MHTALAAPGIPSASRFSRPTWAEINLAALQDNARALSAAHGRCTPLIGVIKANAYGHGAIEVARALLAPEMNGLVVMLAAASVDEGRVLREAGIAAPVLLLSAILPEEAEAAVEADLMVTLSTLDVAAALDSAAQKQHKIARAHFKIDTGMSRMGFSAQDAARCWHALRAYSHVEVDGVFTHFASADETGIDETTGEATLRQINAFESALAECGIAPAEYFVHAANSAATLRYPQARYSAYRTGIALYGASPFGMQDAPEAGALLTPVMNLRSRVTEIRNIKGGQAVSYGGTWRAARDSRLALVPLGYADGFPRLLSNRGEVLLRGRRCPVVGRVTMDQILIDVTEMAPNVQVGEIVTAWGRDESGARLRVEEVAEKAQTIAYEVLCGVARRVPRIYLKPTV